MFRNVSMKLPILAL